MRLKILAPTSFAISFILSVYLLHLTLLNYLYIAISISMVYYFFGLYSSIKNKYHPFNELPNTLRLFLGILGGFYLGMSFSLENITYLIRIYNIVVSFFLLYVSIILNDEDVRRNLRKIIPRNRGYTIALLGIDGSGKSTYSRYIQNLLEKNKYKTLVIPYHRYILLDKIFLYRTKLRKNRNRVFSQYFYYKGSTLTKILRLIRVGLSLIDNIFMYLFLVYPSIIRGKIVILDRFIWSTFIKYRALGYPISSLKPLVFIIKPHYAIVFDIPIQISKERINKRKEFLYYAEEVLKIERNNYLKIAFKYGYPVINTKHTRKYTDIMINGIINKIMKR